MLERQGARTSPLICRGLDRSAMERIARATGPLPDRQRSRPGGLLSRLGAARLWGAFPLLRYECLIRPQCPGLVGNDPARGSVLRRGVPL